jgi:beta-galactosidase
MLLRRCAVPALLLLACTCGTAPAQSAPSPRQQVLLDAHWRFHLGDPPEVGQTLDYPEFARLDKHRPDDEKQSAALAPKQVDAVATHLGESLPVVGAGFDDKAWRSIDLPHDWAVELPFDKKGEKDHGYKALGPDWGTNIGWYRRSFDLPAADGGKTVTLRFDGVYRNCLVWLNGHCLGRNVSGYCSFYYDVTRYALPGRANTLVVRVDATRREGWFYEGAGIYRHVWLTVTDPVHVCTWGTFVSSTVGETAATVSAGTTVRNDGTTAQTVDVASAVVDAAGREVATAGQADVRIPAGEAVELGQTLTVANPTLWSLEQPYLYRVVTRVSRAGQLLDRYETPFGIRTIRFDANAGFFLNGKHVPIQGTANHQDFAGVGIAVPDAVQDYRILELKEAGCNAWRMAHGDPNPELLDACDRLGMLVLDEHRRIGNTPEIFSQLDRLVRRDRNHPSVFLWAIGNEELSAQGSDAFAASVAKPMQDLVHRLDPTRSCTFAMNWDWGKGFSKVIDVQGFNYLLNGMHGKATGRFLDMDQFHAAYPDKPTIGTEESSALSTRGVYEFVKGSGRYTAFGLNLPRNGDKNREWGSTAETWVKYYHDRSWNAGAFVWTGFDYRGEPTPFGWPNISGQWGMLDTCGFPKDVFYYYQACWTDRPVLHVFPHWNWAGQEGKPIDVWVDSNLDEVDLLLNGRGLGRKRVEPLTHLQWRVPYEPGTLLARGFKAGRPAAEDQVQTTGPAAQLRLTGNRTSLAGDGEDAAVVQVAVLDAQGRLVPTADNHVTFEIAGGQILGVGNGDPTCHEPDRASDRSAFNGLAMALVRSLPAGGPVQLTARSDGLRSAQLTIPTVPMPSRLMP